MRIKGNIVKDCRTTTELGQRTDKGVTAPKRRCECSLHALGIHLFNE